MSEAIHTLLLSANGVGWKKVLSDTVVRGVLHDPRNWEELPESWKRRNFFRQIYGQRYETLSYLKDWHDAFIQNRHLVIDDCNINNLIHYGGCLRNIRKYDFIVVLHSATGDNLGLLLKTTAFFQKRRGILLVLVGNEYNLLSNKRKFINDTEADYIGSQLPIDTARWLYSDCIRSRVIETPHALNPDLYHPLPALERTVDIGFIGDFYSYAIGDVERSTIIRFFRENGQSYGLNCMIRQKRLPAVEWNRFLNQCKGIAGAESGTYYLEKDDRTMTAVQDYLRKYPAASFEEVYERFYQNYQNPVNGKALSSRHFEPIGTKTCQVLLEGYYNGILEAGKHYISVKRDFSDIADAIAQFKDADYRNQIVQTAYQYVLENHTYHHRVKSILKEIFQIES
ncbi:MAG: glycosyltransferase family protein [bacterium]|jgi:hypothetical protein